MKVVLEASCLMARNQTGIARICRELLRGYEPLMAPEDTLAYGFQLRRIRRWKIRPRGLAARPLPWAGNWWPPTLDCDLVHAVDHRLPPWARPRKVVTLHDLYAELGVNFEKPRARAMQRAVYKDFAARADLAICVSENTRRDFLRFCDYPEERTRVVPPGVGAQFHPRSLEALSVFRQQYGLDRPYLLFVGNLHPNKNLRRLVEAYGRSVVNADFDLVIVGCGRPEDAAALQQGNQKGRLHVLGSLPEVDLPLAYAAAAALMFPSLYEGFGMPILEGMASGIPVLTSTGGACPEVASDHAELIDPLDVTDLARGMAACLSRTPAQLDAARAHASRYTWQAMAERTWGLYRDALALPRRV